MTSMIDVVFLLIIFFLVSSHLAQQESNLPLELPEARTGSAPVETRGKRVTLNLRADGTIVVGGRELPPVELVDFLQQSLAVKGADVEVRIRASRELPYEQAEALMLQCAKVGIWNVTFAVYPKATAGGA